jgi:hypothetical protein
MVDSEFMEQTKMSRPLISVINVDSNEEFIREMNDEEYESFLNVKNSVPPEIIEG